MNDAEYREAIAKVQDRVTVMVAREREMEVAQEQIDKLAVFILTEVEGEPSENEGAVDTAIRLIRESIVLQRIVP